LTALTTRLLADPPDIIEFSPMFMAFEKMALDSLFADLNDFFDGDRGLDRSLFFENILLAQ